LGAITVAPAFRQRSAEQNVARHHHVARACGLGDPVVRRVKAIANHDPRNQWMIWHPQMAVADDDHRYPAPPRDLIDLVLYRAGVGIDQDSLIGHGRWLTG
jgi:hypothetical protein